MEGRPSRPLLRRIQSDAARRFRESTEAKNPAEANYPSTKLAEKLKLVAKLLKLGGGTRIFYVSQPGYDTHSGRQTLISQTETGTATVYVNERSGLFDDRNGSSPPGARMRRSTPTPIR